MANEEVLAKIVTLKSDYTDEPIYPKTTALAVTTSKGEIVDQKIKEFVRWTDEVKVEGVVEQWVRSVNHVLPTNGNVDVDMSHLVEKEEGKFLMTEEERSKLANIEAAAQRNVQSDWQCSDPQLATYIVNKPSALPADGGDADCSKCIVTEDDNNDRLFIRVVDGKIQIVGQIDGVEAPIDFESDDYLTSEEVEQLLSTVYKYKGSVTNKADLPAGAAIGDVYNVVNEDGMNYAWNGTEWDSLGFNIDLSNYYTKAEVDDKTRIADILTSTDATASLSANQGRVLDEKKFDKADFTAENITNIINNGASNTLNASTLDGIDSTGFVQKRTDLTVEVVNDANYKVSYIGCINLTASDVAGLAAGWWHIIYMPHVDNNGYGAQIAIPYSTAHASDPNMKYRISTDATWGAWVNVNDGGNAAQLGGIAAASYFYAHSSPVAGQFDTSTTVPTATNRLNYNGNLYTTKVFGSVYNDYAEFRDSVGNIEPGRVVSINDDGNFEISTKRLQPVSRIVSNTYGMVIGKDESVPYQNALAVSGRALVYLDCPITKDVLRKPVCSGPYGNASIMTREEMIEHPDCIIGVISSIPKEETWGNENISTKYKVWVEVR